MVVTLKLDIHDTSAIRTWIRRLEAIGMPCLGDFVALPGGHESSVEACRWDEDLRHLEVRLMRLSMSQNRLAGYSKVLDEKGWIEAIQVKS